MRMEDQNETQIISLKLLVDTKVNKVLFAEAGKEFVDFIFHIMSLPLGTIVKFLNQMSMAGCLGELYKSVESLNNQYFHSDLNKESVLNPKTVVNVPLLSLNEAPSTPNKLYDCCSSCGYVTYVHGTKCPHCRQGMCKELVFAGPTGSANTAASRISGSEGYVKGVVTYMVMDNLEVKPMSTISGITFINKFSVKDMSSLEEKVVQVGLKEVRLILLN